MSLFDKSDMKKAPPDSTRLDKAQPHDIKPEIRFYSFCVEDYHNTAKKEGMATRGVIFIPELIPIGEKTILAFLRDSFYQAQFSNNPSAYYYVIMSLSMQAGMVFAAKWHTNYSSLKEGYVERIIEEGPYDACRPLLNELGLTDTEKENNYYSRIFERWLALHEPYWKLPDPREYTFNAMLAAYQLGVSMILGIYGY